MPAVKVPAGSTMRIVLQTGTDTNGNPILRNKNFDGIKTNADVQSVYDVAQALVNLQKYTLSGVRQVDLSRIENQ